MLIVIIGIIIFLVIVIVISTILGNLKNRAMQTVLKDTPLSSSAMSKTTESILGKKATKKFLEEYGNIYTEENLKSYLCEIGQNLINNQSMDIFSQKVIDKMGSDAKLNKLRQSQITRVSVMSYARNVLTSFVVVSNGRDEYMISIYSDVDANGISSVKDYRIQKGVAVGF
ncbi:MAG: hypothetical protein J6J36_03585 [Clostridia bacterium]|nr:hypothetical protein [Clostridia bacterium]